MRIVQCANSQYSRATEIKQSVRDSALFFDIAATGSIRTEQISGYPQNPRHPRRTVSEEPARAAVFELL
jgi:hypothetical protein